MTDDICSSCGFPLSSDTHMRGIGLHGHISTSKEEADEQRAEVFARAQAFSDELLADNGFAPAPQLSREEKIKAAIELLTEEGIITPVNVSLDEDEGAESTPDSPQPAKRGRPRKEVKENGDE